MNVKNIKFISANIAVIAIWAFVLFRHYTLAGLISFLACSLILFLGTLFDKGKSVWGVFCKLDLYVFITFLSLFGIWLPFVLNNKSVFNFDGNETNMWGFLFSLSAFFVFLIMTSSKKFSHYALKRVFKYTALLCLILVVYYLFSFNLKQIIVITPIISLFAFADIYVAGMEKEKSGDNAISTTYKTYWMAFAICALIIYLNIYCASYLNGFIGTFAQVKVLISSLLSRINIIIFAIIMLAITSIFMYADGLEENFSSCDSYFALSLGGTGFVLRTYFSNADKKTLIVLLASLLIYAAIGFYILKLNKSKKNFLYNALSKGKFAPAVFSLVITCASVLSIIFVYKGYAVSLILLICGITFIANSEKIFQGFWVANTMRWQMVLLTITLVMCSVAIINNNWDNAGSVLLFEFVISSLIMWSFGIRDSVWDNKYTISKVVDCVLLAGISLFAVI